MRTCANVLIFERFFFPITWVDVIGKKRSDGAPLS